MIEVHHRGLIDVMTVPVIALVGQHPLTEMDTSTAGK